MEPLVSMSHSAFSWTAITIRTTITNTVRIHDKNKRSTLEFSSARENRIDGLDTETLSYPTDRQCTHWIIFRDGQVFRGVVDRGVLGGSSMINERSIKLIAGVTVSIIKQTTN